MINYFVLHVANGAMFEDDVLWYMKRGSGDAGRSGSGGRLIRGEERVT